MLNGRVVILVLDAGERVIGEKLVHKLEIRKNGSIRLYLLLRSFRLLRLALQPLLMSISVREPMFAFLLPRLVAMVAEQSALVMDLDASTGIRFPAEDGLSAEADGDRVTIAAISEHAVFGRAAICLVAGVVIAKLFEEEQPFLRQALVGAPLR